MDRSFPVALFSALRPRQWMKNVFVFAALVFAGHVEAPAYVLRVGRAFVGLCALSPSVYLLNDVLDREADRRHPHKRHRPIAAGVVAPGTAVALSLVLGTLAAVAAFSLSTGFGVVACAYLALSVSYSLG